MGDRVGTNPLLEVLMPIDYSKIEISVSGATYEWSAEHAAIAHEGAVTTNGTVIPPRRWTELALQRFQFDERLATEYQANGGDLSKAFIKVSREFNDELRKAIADPSYQWPRSTQRSNGQTVGSPRNIVDEGTLIRSQSMRIT